MLQEQPKRRKVRATRERILIDCKASIGHLKQINRGEKETCYIDNLGLYGDGSKSPDPDGEYLVQLFDRAWDAVGPLEKFIKLLEGYHQAEDKRIGRKQADSDHFIRKIRDCYIEHIGKPTAHREGPFYDVVKVVLEILGLSYEDPSRGIKAALKTR